MAVNGTMVQCAQQAQLARVPAIAQPFSVFYGSLQRINSGAAGYNRNKVSTIPVVQILGANPRRVALEIWPNPSTLGNVVLATQVTPGGFQSVMLVENGQNPLVVSPDLTYVTSAFYACYEAAADNATDALALTGWEWVI